MRTRRLRGSNKTGTGSEPKDDSRAKTACREVPVPVLLERVRLLNSALRLYHQAGIPAERLEGLARRDTIE